MSHKKDPLNWQILIKVFSFAKPHWQWLALSLANSVKGVAMQLMTPYLIQIVTDSVVAQQTQDLMRGLILASGAILLDVALTFLGRRAFTRYISYTIRDLRDRVTAHIQQLPMAFLDTFHSGDLTSRLNADVGKISGWLTSAPEMVVQPLLFLGGVIYMLTINWKLLLVSSIFIPAATAIHNRFNKPTEEMARKQAEAEGQVNAALQDAIAGITMVKAFNLQTFLGERFLNLAKAVERQALRLDWRRALGLVVYLAVRYIPQLIVPLYGGWLAYRGELSVGQLIAANMVIWTVFMPVERMLGMLSQVRETVPVAERVFALLDHPTELYGTQAFSAIPAMNPVEFEGVTFGYEADDPILKNMELQLLADQTTAVVGPSGCGKSTLFKLLCGFYKPQNGQVRVWGNDLATTDLAASRSQISLVSQDTYLFPVSIAQNIAYGRPDATEVEIITAAKAANAHDFILEQPKGYETLVGERGARLSGGQRQRIALARAILKDAPILLLDEPTSALDTQSEVIVQEALDRFMVGRTALIVAHRLSTIQNADRILVMDNGQICEEGTHDTVMAEDGLYRRLVQKQVGKEVA
ncbi:MAG: ABC transporter ATP-binding protein [Anaerolineales bacterium]|nr:MAG: ABC transporter ATP-binding protein [Anaerolineales bacterium]